MRLAASLLPILLALSASAQELQTDDQKTLYALGAALGRNVQVFQLSPDELKFVQLGIEDSVKGGQLKVDFNEWAPKIDQLARERQAKAAEAEKGKAKEYQEKAAKEKGAEKAASGLIYIPIKKGKGDSPKATDRVKVHYHGTLTNGEVFDSSVERKEPATFPLNGVIPCWTEGVQKMKVGGKAKLVCPSAIAYGDQGRPPRIPGGATLVFEVELLEIEKEKASTPAPAPATKK